MRKVKNESKWIIQGAGLNFNLAFRAMTLEKMTGFFKGNEKQAPEFKEYISSIEFELAVKANIPSEIEDDFKIKVKSHNFFMETDADRNIYEVEDVFGEDGTIIPIFLSTNQEDRRFFERINVAVSYEGETIFEKCFLINFTGGIEECPDPEKVLKIDQKEE